MHFVDPHLPKRIDRWRSPALGLEMPIVQYGWRGQPVLLFPTAAADFLENERFWLIKAIEPLLQQGRIRVFSIDSINRLAWMDRTLPAPEAARRQALYSRYVEDEVVPAADRLREIVAGPTGERAAGQIVVLGGEEADHGLCQDREDEGDHHPGAEGIVSEEAACLAAGDIEAIAQSGGGRADEAREAGRGRADEAPEEAPGEKHEHRVAVPAVPAQRRVAELFGVVGGRPGGDDEKDERPVEQARGEVPHAPGGGVSGGRAGGHFFSR